MSVAPFAIAGDFISNSALQAQQADYNKKATDRAFSQSLEAQNMAPQNYLSGLRSAGLPVSLALKGGAFQPSTAPSPMPITSHPVSVTNAIAADAALKQSELVEAQKTKLEAETTSIEKRNQREADEDYTIDENLRSWLRSEAEKDSPNSDFYSALADSPELFSRGTLQAIKDFDSTLSSLDDSSLKKLSNEFYKLVFNSQINNGIAQVVADVPKNEQLKMFADLSKVYSEIAKLLVDTDLDKAKIQEVMASIDKIRGDTDNAYYSNFTRMVKNKDYLSAGVSLFGSAVNAFASGAGQGSGLGLGASVAKKAVQVPFKPDSAGSKPSSSFPHPEGYRRY